MYFYTDTGRIKIPNNVLLNKIGSGNETNVYRFKNKVLKIYKILKITLPDEECHKNMVSLKTTNIITPEVLCYNRNNIYVANISQYIKPIHNSILDYTFEEFMLNISLLENDVILLTENNIRLKDIVQISNTVFGQKIYLVDFGLYETNTNFTYEQLLRNNMYNFKLYVQNLIIYELENRNLLTHELRMLYLNSLKHDITFRDYLNENCEKTNKIFKKTCK